MEAQEHARGNHHRLPNAALAVAALAAIALGCRSNTAPPAVDPALTACLAPGTSVIAGVDLNRLRASPLYRSLPDSTRALTAVYQNASRLLVAYDGKAILVIAGGNTGAAPALYGPPDSVRAALAQRRIGRTAVPGLVAFAASIAAANPVWIAAQGGVTLPLTGNAANLNRLLSYQEFAGLTLQLEPAAALHLTALGRDAGNAQRFEETFRAMLTMASAAQLRQPEIAALLSAIPVDRSGRTVTASANVPPPMLEKLLGEFAPR